MSNIFDIYKTESESQIGAQRSLRQQSGRPFMLIKRIALRSPERISDSSDSCLGSGVKEEKTDDNDLESLKKIIDCSVYEDILEKNKPAPVTEYVPIFDNVKIRMSFGPYEDISDRIHTIGFDLAGRALRALRTVVKTKEGSQFIRNHIHSKVPL
ncbi:unnamed protein product [Thelazia callipaeda]|uniref:DUF4806 domain-containing protein n=1 Tax=Thelazia callipaeda TaxID=103827 RepID=A0A0N5CPL9_THECL|nr:unnamed protein product [Thelazia callipaeda]